MGLALSSAVDRDAALRAAAERLSANAFFNALLRESSGWAWVEQPPLAAAAGALCWPLAGDDDLLWLPLDYRSNCGRHQFRLPLYRQRPGQAPTPLALMDAVRLIAARPALFPAAGARERALFVERVQASLDNLEAAITVRAADLPALFAQSLDFARAEQGLLSGHSVHPTPKSRDQFEPQDAALYAPEHGGEFALHWLWVDPRQLQSASSDALGAEGHARRLFEGEEDVIGERRARSGDGLPVPMHPWQWQRLRRDPRVAALLARGRIRELGPGVNGWRATSSLRSVYAPHAPDMLKFSLSLRLTNSLRTLLPQEMRRGLSLYRVLQTPLGREFERRCPQFQVLCEPAFLSLRDGEGSPIVESLVLFRDNPFRGAAGAHCCVLATLTQDDPLGGAARVAQLIRQLQEHHRLGAAVAAATWFERFLDVVVEPLALAQADYGLLFGAHQQNLVLRFDGPLPVAAYFRDCQGSGYSDLARQRLADALPDLGQETQNLLDADFGNRLLAYYVIVNSTFGVISAIAAAGLVDETTLLRQLRRRLESLREAGPRDTRWLDYLLDAPELWAKGNFFCAFTNLNETTAADPLAVYHRLPNPLRTGTT